MLNLKLNFRKLELDKIRYVNVFRHKLEEEFANALKAALHDIIPKIPVYTGEARGTLRPIGRFVNEIIPINPVGKRRGHTPETGDAKSVIKFSLGLNGLRPTFKINIDLFHLEWNEENPSPVSPTAPWHAFEAGREAFKAYLRANLVNNLPKVKDFISGTELRIG